jgi:serine/threonine protein phosphatase 1
MMLGARDHADMDFQWRRSGGEETLSSYNAREVGEIPPAHWKFIEETCVDWWEARTHFFVHANAYPDFPLEEQPEYMLFWQKFNRPAPHVSGKVMVCGHTSQKSGLPINIGHAVCLDTRAAKGGWLSCLDTGSGRLWQANQRGEVRKMWLDEV